MFLTKEIMYLCVLKVSGCEEEVYDGIERAATEGAESTCGTECHQLNNGHEIFPSENVSCRRF